MDTSAPRVPRSPAIPPPPISSTIPPSSKACASTSAIASAQASASQHITWISAAAATSVSSTQAAQDSLQQNVDPINSSLESLESDYIQAGSPASASLGIASNNVALAISSANSAVAAKVPAQQTASDVLERVQCSTSISLSIATSSTFSAIASATSLVTVVQSSANSAASSTYASAKTQATTTFEVRGDSVASPISPESSAIRICDIASTTNFRLVSAILSIILLFVLSIFVCLLVTRFRDHRKSRKLYNIEALLEVREAREMQPRDIDLLYPIPAFEFRKGFSSSKTRPEKTPISPVTSVFKLPSHFSSPTNQFPAYNTLGISRPSSERRPSALIEFSGPFQPRPGRRPSSPTVSANELTTSYTSEKAQWPALEIMIPNSASDSDSEPNSSNHDTTLFQFPCPQGRSITHPSQMQKIFWSFPPAATESPQPAFESESSTPSFGFQTIPPPLSPRSKTPTFPTHASSQTSFIPHVKQLKPSKNLTSLTLNKVSDDAPLEMKQRSRSVPDREIIAFINGIEALSQEQERRRRIEGWFDTPGWGEGSIRSAGMGRERPQSVTTIATTEGNRGFHIGEAF